MPLLPLYLALPLASKYPPPLAPGRPGFAFGPRARGARRRGAARFRDLHTPGSDTTPSGSEGPGTGPLSGRGVYL